MENLIKHFETIESPFRKTKAVTVACVAGSALVAVVSLVFAATWIGSHSDNVYVLDKGGAFSATVSAGEVQRDLEAIDHVTRFHEHMFNLSPSSEAIKRGVEQALVMADRSAYTYFNDLQEQGFYSRLVQANVTQQILIDSVKVDMGTYPYPETTYAKVYVVRESNISAYDFVSTGRLVDVGRSKSNPHGFMIERFQVVKNERTETRRRN